MAETSLKNNGVTVGPQQVFWDALAKGEFIIQQCKDCGLHVFYPRALCNHCGSNDLTWVQAVGRGEVYSTTVIHQRPEKGGDYNLVLITLEEGPRMMSRIIDIDPEEVTIGMKVSAHITLIDDEPAVVFSTQTEGEGEW